MYSPIYAGSPEEVVTVVGVAPAERIPDKSLRPRMRADGFVSTGPVPGGGLNSSRFNPLLLVEAGQPPRMVSAVMPANHAHRPRGSISQLLVWNRDRCNP